MYVFGALGYFYYGPNSKDYITLNCLKTMRKNQYYRVVQGIAEYDH